jgi:tRNA (guanine37-N1)-methyltransferase
MRFDVLTLFPEIFQGYLTQSILKLALERGLVDIHLWNIRDWATGKHKQVDDRPFGGGPGMVIMPGPVFDAVEAVRSKAEEVGELICNGGEVPAMVLIDTIIRYVPGVLGDPASVAEESHSETGRLEYPQYTRPRDFRGMAVPDLLLSGNHPAIARWRREQSEARSASTRKEGSDDEKPINPGRGSSQLSSRNPGL